jgi:NodT family efflux transporter outer membrane factor (OMF) lipoprotein
MTKATAKIKPLRTLTIAVLTSLSSACTTLGPDYERPPMDLPDSYKESPETTDPQINQQDEHAKWWSIYNDQELDKLIAQIDSQNYSLQAAAARLQQARELAKIAEAAQYPTVTAGGVNDLGIIANWEVDLWGRIKRNIEASGAAAQASAADLAATKLLLQAELAQNYFLLRIQDGDIQLLKDTIASYQRSLNITRNQYDVGVADRGSVTQARLQLSNAQVQMHEAKLTRAQLEHTLAVLVGKTPADFSINASTTSTEEFHIPQVPALLPSDLLERRPDIAAAERRMAAASANIGVAAAAAYPTLDLFAGATITRGLVGGADVEAPIYTAGATTAKRTKAEAAFDETIANYRQVILKALREVEDNLVTLQSLEESSKVQIEAFEAAREAVVVINNQYQAGIVSYLAVAFVQSSELDSKRASLSILGRRLVASVTLTKALGGGWQASELEKEPEDISEDLPDDTDDRY